MQSKKWIKIFLIIPTLSIVFFGSVNFVVDPLWSFNHTNKFNKTQLLFNERQQKTNNVYFNGLDKYDGILFGSSRTSFINQNEFHNMNIYNYALNSMFPFEYEGYLKLAKESKGKEFKYVIIGADFYGSKLRTKKMQNPSHYIENTKSPFYRYKMLLSIGAFKKSIENIKINLFKQPNAYYTRDNVKIRGRVSEEERIKKYTKNLKIHTEYHMKDAHKKDKEYINILKRLKIENPNTKFIIFTFPITADLLVSIIKNGHQLEEFEKWLKEIIEVFGEVHHFMTINNITTNLQNYPDDDHLYPNYAKLIANKLTDTKNSDIPKDFGVLLNEKNIDNYIINFEKQLKEYKNPLELQSY